jgi:DNA replication protein DnaC
VRITDESEVIPTHPRSYNRDQVIERPAYVQALVDSKRAAKHHSTMERLHQALSHSRDLLRLAAERGGNLGSPERCFKFDRICLFKSMAEFDWQWSTTLNRDAVEELFTLEFLLDGANAVLPGPNGVGKTMLLRNLAHQALLCGHTVRFTMASLASSKSFAEIFRQNSALPRDR